MLLNEREFKSHIRKKEYSNLYVLTGDEKYLVRHYTGEFVNGVMGENPPDFNYHSLNSGTTVEQIAIAADVVPFMSEYNFVKVTDYNINELRKEDFEKLKHILKNLPSTTILLFTFPTLEISGKNFSSVMTYAKNNGIAVEFKKYDKNALAKTLVEGAYKRGCSLAEVNAGKIVDYCGTDLIALQNELEKLCNYANGKEITIEMIDSLVHINLETKVYYLADNIISNNISKAYEQLAILFDQKAEPVMIVSSIAGAYIDLYRSRVANENGLSMEKVAEDFGYGKRSFVLKNKLKAGWKIPTDKIRDSINIIAETDYKMKSTSADDKVLLETLIAKLSLIARGELKNA